MKRADQSCPYSEDNTDRLMVQPFIGAQGEKLLVRADSCAMAIITRSNSFRPSTAEAGSRSAPPTVGEGRALGTVVVEVA
ncbi:MAG TPA: hypothetical protein VLA91_02300 [Acidimicrobiia bacterium]|nr:hypothetical protein [Acidimicrobiia bacterium]